MKEDNTPIVTSRRRTPSSKLRLRLENAKRLKALNTHSKTVRAKKKEAKRNAAKSDPQDHVFVSRLPKIKKNHLAEPPKATSKFKKRQVHKTWLPTHLWHAKRAHMTKPSEPLWRMAIPLSPTEKSYRPSHRASGGRGCLAWDMSYMCTISCKGLEASLDSMLKAINFHGEGRAGAKHKRWWRKGTRSADGWFYERDNNKRLIAPVMVIWCVEAAQVVKKVKLLPPHDGDGGSGDKGDAEPSSKAPLPRKMKTPERQLFIRVHPSAFHRLWIELMKVAKMQRPQVTLEDLRFQIGSVEVTGPGSTEALLGVLKPVTSADLNPRSPQIVWTSLAGLTNPASLPQGSLLAFNVCDPRLNHPPKQMRNTTNHASVIALTELMVSWPVDATQTTPDIFSHKLRYTASRSMPSQKAINRRKALAQPGQLPESKDTDPQIPVMLISSRAPVNSGGAQGTWTLLLPWKCVDPVWRSLLYYPLCSGGTPRFGGLDEKRQIVFEKGDAWFPGDLPGTEAGIAWEGTQADKRYDEWRRRPPSRRIAWEMADLGGGKKGEHGRGWSCDWEFLVEGKIPENGRSREEDVTAADKSGGKEPAQESDGHGGSNAGDGQDNEVAEAKQQDGQNAAEATNLLNPNAAKGSQHSVALTHLPPPLAIPLFDSFNTVSLPSLPELATIRVTLLTRGTPNPCARIYRLPPPSTPDDDAKTKLRKEWLALDPTTSSTRPQPPPSPANSKMQKDQSNHRNESKGHRIYPQEDLDVIDHRHPGAPPEVYAKHYQNAKPAVEAEAEHAKLLASLMPTAPGKNQQHPPCPDVGDLIGFVTSGAYNLAEGKGTAIGSIWVQRVVEGWRTDGRLSDRQRRLCVVRNAGEGVGRLGIWQVCG